LGTLSAGGIGIDSLWETISSGRSAIRPIDAFDASGFPLGLAGQVGGGPGGAEFSAKDFVPKSYRKAAKVMARDIELAVAAAKLAVDDAGITTRGNAPEENPSASTYKPDRIGCHVGAGLIAADAEELSAAFSTARSGAPGTPNHDRLDLTAWGSQGMEALTPLWLLKYLPNMLACHVTIIHGCEGPSNTITCAEASGLLSLGESARVIERGAADACFSGGAESKVNLMGLLRNDFAGRMAHTPGETDPVAVLKPFDPKSRGGIIGEGAGILIVEAEETAAARGARVHARVAGLGAGHSPFRPERGGVDDGLLAAVENALADARVGPGEIDAIVPSATGVPDADATEAATLAAAFGSRLAEVELITLAPVIGNCTAATGALQAAVAAAALSRQWLPARVHGGTPVVGLRAGAAPARAAQLRRVLVVTASLGGQNAAVVLERPGVAGP
jgi:3-oxoacyl-[acyl-carrier-protein] synthase II